MIYLLSVPTIKKNLSRKMNSDFLEYLISWAQRINLKNYMKLHVSNPPSRYRFQEGLDL